MSAVSDLRCRVAAEFHITIANGDKRDGQLWHSLKAARAVPRGAVVLREVPLMALGFAQSPFNRVVADESYRAVALRRQLKDWRTLALVEYVFRHKRHLLEPPTWLDEYCESNASPLSLIPADAASMIAQIMPTVPECEQQLACHLFRVLCANSFASETILCPEAHGIAFYALASYANHNCMPNCWWSVERDQAIVLRAVQDIEPDAEILIAYDGVLGPLRQFSPARLSFDCRCTSCVVVSSDASIPSHLADLEQKVAALVGLVSNMGANAHSAKQHVTAILEDGEWLTACSVGGATTAMCISALRAAAKVVSFVMAPGRFDDCVWYFRVGDGMSKSWSAIFTRMPEFSNCGVVSPPCAAHLYECVKLFAGLQVSKCLLRTSTDYAKAIADVNRVRDALDSERRQLIRAITRHLEIDMVAAEGLIGHFGAFHQRLDLDPAVN
jgi:hypothetical protein